MFSILSKSFKTGILTEPIPFERPVSFGFPVIDFARCTMCDACAKACPTGAIQSTAPEPGSRRLSLSYAACIQCRECIGLCPEQAVRAGTQGEVAAYTREQLQQSALFDADPVTGACTLPEAP